MVNPENPTPDNLALKIPMFLFIHEDIITQLHRKFSHPMVSRKLGKVKNIIQQFIDQKTLSAMFINMSWPNLKRMIETIFQESYNTPLEHTPGNPPTQL